MTEKIGKLYLFPHTQSENNLGNVFSGWENPGLTTEGEKDAQAMGKLLRQNRIGFNLFECSTQKRSLQTLFNLCLTYYQEVDDEELRRFFEEVLSLSTQIFHNALPEVISDKDKPILERKIFRLNNTIVAPIIATTALVEKGYGIYAGRPREDIREESNEIYRNLRDNSDYLPPSGENRHQYAENYGMVRDRATPELELIKEELRNGKNILHIGHSNTIRVIAATLLGNFSQEEKQKWRKISIRNTMFKLNFDGKSKWEIVESYKV